jgi:hypothetical protein
MVGNFRRSQIVGTELSAVRKLCAAREKALKRLAHLIHIIDVAGRLPLCPPGRWMQPEVLRSASGNPVGSSKPIPVLWHFEELGT